MSIRFADLREVSSDWRLTCPTHGNVVDVLLSDEDWQNALCGKCIVSDLAKSAKKAVFNPNGGPMPSALKAG